MYWRGIQREYFPVFVSQRTRKLILVCQRGRKKIFDGFAPTKFCELNGLCENGWLGTSAAETGTRGKIFVVAEATTRKAAEDSRR
jgi:hypothetical protein